MTGKIKFVYGRSGFGKAVVEGRNFYFHANEDDEKRFTEGTMVEFEDTGSKFGPLPGNLAENVRKVVNHQLKEG